MSNGGINIVQKLLNQLRRNLTTFSGQNVLNVDKCKKKY